MTCILLTGSSGFLGRHVTLSAERAGLRVVRALRQEGPSTDDAIRLGSARWGREHFALALARSRADVVVHCAGATVADDSWHFFEANVSPALGLLEAVATAAVPPRVVLVGSAAEYGIVAPGDQPVIEDHPCRPTGTYGVAKHAQTLLGLAAAARGSPVLVVRLFNAIGPGMPAHLALPSFARRLVAASATGGVLRVGDLGVERDFIAVEEAARLLVELASMPHWPWPLVNLCSGRAYRMRDILGMMIERSGLSVRVEVDPGLLRPGDMPRFVGSIGRLVGAGLHPAPPDLKAIVADALIEARANA